MRSRRNRFVTVAALLAAGAGVGVGTTLLVVGSDAGPEAGEPARAAGNEILMSEAKVASCTKPAEPGPAHPDRLLSQLFTVADSHGAQYLLGLQLVPFDGAHEYRLGTGGNVLSLQGPTGGKSLGFATGKASTASDGLSGEMDARISLVPSGSVRVRGHWTC